MAQVILLIEYITPRFEFNHIKTAHDYKKLVINTGIFHHCNKKKEEKKESIVELIQ